LVPEVGWTVNQRTWTKAPRRRIAYLRAGAQNCCREKRESQPAPAYIGTRSNHEEAVKLSVREKQKESIELIVVVSGQSERLRVNLHQTLEHLVHEALQKSGNQGQAPSEWELRTEDGRLLDQALTAATAGLHDGTTLFLSPKAGAGG
jgi:hypothetical protein